MDFDVKAIKNMDLFSNSSIKIDNLVGEWVQYEDRILSLICWKFMRDGTYVYKSYNYDSQLIFNNSGTFTLEDNVLTIDYSGFNIPERIISCTDSEFSSSSDTYYKVIGDYSMALDDNPITIGNDGDIIKYVDNCIIGIENNKIVPLKGGSGYALVEDALTKQIKAFRVDILSVGVQDFAQYLMKTETEILDEFGTSMTKDDITQGDITNSMAYLFYNDDIMMLKFFFPEDWSKVIKIQVTFMSAENGQTYRDTIEENYYYNTTQKVYYNTKDSSQSSVKIRILSSSITYEYIEQ